MGFNPLCITFAKIRTFTLLILLFIQRTSVLTFTIFLSLCTGGASLCVNSQREFSIGEGYKMIYLRIYVSIRQLAAPRSPLGGFGEQQVTVCEDPQLMLRIFFLNTVMYHRVPPRVNRLFNLVCYYPFY